MPLLMKCLKFIHEMHFIIKIQLFYVENLSYPLPLLNFIENNFENNLSIDSHK